MRTCVVFLAALLAMAAAQGDYNGNQSPSLENPDPAFYRPSSSNQGPSLQNPDPFFSQPHNPSGGYEPISYGPAFVENSGRPPYKQYDNQYARGGK